METVRDFIYFFNSEFTVDDGCSHEIKRCLLLGRKVMTNLDSIFKSRDITLPTKVCLVKAMIFPVAKVLEFQLQHHSLQRNPRADFLQNGLVGSHCSPRRSSPTPQFKSINSLVLSFLHSPTLTSIHDHRKNHSPD